MMFSTRVFVMQLSAPLPTQIIRTCDCWQNDDSRIGHITRTELNLVVKLLSKRWLIPIGARPEGPKLEPEGPRAEVGFPTADLGFSSIQGTLLGFYGILISK